MNDATLKNDPKFGPHLIIKNLNSSISLDAGSFKPWSIAELQEIANITTFQNATTTAPDLKPIFEIHIRNVPEMLPYVDVTSLQIHSEHDCGDVSSGPPLFQVASISTVVRTLMMV